MRSGRLALVVALGVVAYGVHLVGLRTESSGRTWPALEGWAEPIGSGTDPQSGYPTQVRRIVDGAIMALVPGGTFVMGSGADSTWPDERPERQLEIRPFYMDQHEVTFAQYAAFVGATGHVAVLPKSGAGYGLAPEGSDEHMAMIEGLSWKDCNPCSGGPPDNHPVSCVTWSDALAYADWVGASLPIEEEFEYVLGAGAGGAEYPWGDMTYLPPRFANVHGPEVSRAYPTSVDAESCIQGADDGFVGTAPVKSFPPNRWGLYDLCGNLSEWCAGTLDVPYVPGQLAVDRDRVDRVARGGGWHSTIGELRVRNRKPVHRDIVRAYLGFRCVRRLPLSPD